MSDSDEDQESIALDYALGWAAVHSLENAASSGETVTEKPPAEPQQGGPEPLLSEKKTVTFEISDAVSSLSEPMRSKAPLLCLGMARTGTASLGAALNVLGIGRVHHGLYTQKEDWQWELFDRAADASFPALPTYTGKPFTRADWDELWQHYDVGTDIASFYAMSLIAAYPDAKVILVERDIQRWHKSIGLIFKPWASWTSRTAVKIVSPLAGTRLAAACYKFSLGWTESRHPRDIWKNASAAYKKHYENIRRAVPPEQLLEFKLSDGWEPLAKFLGKEAPGSDVNFPHINDASAFEDQLKQSRKDLINRAAKNVFLIDFRATLARLRRNKLAQN